MSRPNHPENIYFYNLGHGEGTVDNVFVQTRISRPYFFFDDDDRVYLIYGAGTLRLVELTHDALGIKPGTTEQVIIGNASAPAGPDTGLRAEGSQLFKVNGEYYLFNITWPKGGMRTVVIHRASKITVGP